MQETQMTKNMEKCINTGFDQYTTYWIKIYKKDIADLSVRCKNK